MSSSLPDGYTVRAAVPEDIDTAAAIVRAEEAALRGESIWSAPDMIDFWRQVDFEGGAWIVESEGVPVAFAAMVARENWADCWSSVDPVAGDRGLATWLLGRFEERAREHGIERIKAGRFAENTAAHQLFERLGYSEARHYVQMRIELDREPEPPEWPGGIEPSPFREEDARAFHAAVQEAFRDEWGFVGLPFEDWKRTRLGAPETDTSLWFLARDGDEIAGFARCDAERDGGGWIGMIGVREAWRRRGIGLALLQQAFREFFRRGVPHVGLGVDADNPTEATRLYEKAGMRVIKEDVVYEKELS
jgi:mycothiol synthase